ncbi:MAG: hypothetical protein AUG49_10340 [Catenulispora sp. 13_1_20CM_3_70_7]|nr:MAG: hypothetical protein AUG49_10340 [Catenulispora sp. 13_1_20CM_3_70_7]
MRGLTRRQPGADVDELAQARGGQVTDRAAQEVALLAAGVADVRVGADDDLGGAAVGVEVVLTAEQEVVDPGDVRGVGVDHGRPPAGRVDVEQRRKRPQSVVVGHAPSWRVWPGAGFVSARRAPRITKVPLESRVRHVTI